MLIVDINYEFGCLEHLKLRTETDASSMEGIYERNAQLSNTMKLTWMFLSLTPQKHDGFFD